MTGEEFRKESDGRVYLLLQKTKETFEERMIQYARPKGILPMVKSEQKDKYEYEITGRKTLAVTFERVPMNAEQVEKVLDGILDVLEDGREYLLSEHNFILNPEHIYLRIPEYEVMLCYYPEYEIPFAEQLGKLFEMLLNRVDYREEKAISMVYALYMQLQEPDMTLERIREELREQAAGSGERLLKALRPAEEKTEPELLLYTMNKGKAEKGREPEKAEIKKSGIWERLRKEVEAKMAKRGEKASPAVPVPCVREIPPEWGTQYTKVLAVNKRENGPALISQRNGETIFLTKFPFYVGSLPEYMDYVIEQDTVSRFHAKFVKHGSTISLVDLNSTNGTKVNDRMLNVGEQRNLVHKDRIVFADAEYVFFEKEE